MNVGSAILSLSLLTMFIASRAQDGVDGLIVVLLLGTLAQCFIAAWEDALK
jgi:hypothetical protein